MFLCVSSVDFEDVSGICFGTVCGTCWGVAGFCLSFDVDDFAVCVYPDDVEGYQGVFHPELMCAIVFEDKEHATGFAEFGAVHETFGDFFWCCRKFCFYAYVFEAYCVLVLFLCGGQEEDGESYDY